MADQSTATLGLGNPYSATNLLAHGLKSASRFNLMQLPGTEQLRKDRLDALLNAPAGRDFTINTSVGVVFKVHSIMLIGGPKALEQVAFSEQNVSNDKTVNLPDRFHPLLVDRLVSFIYTSAYPVDTHTIKINTLLHHAFLLPGATPSSFGLSIDAAEFQICMYGMAEVLEYSALMSFAYSRLTSYFIFDHKAPKHVCQLIKLVFAPAGSKDRKCKDEVGALKGLGIAAVLVHEKKHWSGLEMDEFRDLLANDLDQDAWKEYRACHKQIKDANQELLTGPQSASHMHDHATRQATRNVYSLVSSMSNVTLAGGNKPSVLETLHGAFDEYAYWTMKPLKAKTGHSGSVLNEALPKIAQKLKGGQFDGHWQRKASFNRPSLWMCTEAILKRRSETQDLRSFGDGKQAKSMGIGHQTAAKATNFLDRSGAPPAPNATSVPSNDTRENIRLAKRKFAKATRKFITTPSDLKIVDNDGEDNTMDHDAADATGMMDSKYAPKAAKLGDKGMANATFDFASRTMDFSFTPVAAPQPGTISLEGLKALQQASVANIQAKKTVKAAKKADVDPDENKENIPLESNYAVPRVEDEQAADEEMVD